jgi:hypothetical protein
MQMRWAPEHRSAQSKPGAEAVSKRVSKAEIARRHHIERTSVRRILRKDWFMSSSSMEFHEIWIEQCAAAEDIREQFGLNSASDYLIGEKLFTFVTASEQDPDFAAELPAFLTAIRRVFAAEEIREYLDHLEQTKFLPPPEPEIEMDDGDEAVEEEPWPANPAWGAEELLRFSRIRQILQSW